MILLLFFGLQLRYTYFGYSTLDYNSRLQALAPVTIFPFLPHVFHPVFFFCILVILVEFFLIISKKYNEYIRLLFCNSISEFQHLSKREKEVLYSYLNIHESVYQLIYADNMLLVSNNLMGDQEAKARLPAEFEMKDLGAATKILRIDIIRDMEK